MRCRRPRSTSQAAIIAARIKRMTPTANPAAAAAGRLLLPLLLPPPPGCAAGEAAIVGAPTEALAETDAVGSPEAFATAVRNELKGPGGEAAWADVVLPLVGDAAKEASRVERGAGTTGVPSVAPVHDVTETTRDIVVDKLDG